MVANHIGTRHYSFTFTVQQGIDVLADVIHHLETFDVTTIRASTPMPMNAALSEESVALNDPSWLKRGPNSAQPKPQ